MTFDPALLSLRDATLDDLPGIVAIYNSTVASRQVTADLDPIPVDSRVAWFHAHQPKTRPLWVVEHNGVMLGWLSLSDFYGRPAYHRTAEVSIYLSEAARGKGLGRYLLQQLIARAPGFGVRTLLGFIFGHNEASLRLFSAFGFARWGDLPGVAELDGVERDLIIVGLRLPDGVPA
ncbi:GCN5-related N-acetyltransferase [Pandoraea terrae]|uniref:GCN5-related N-acetyltransferase n=1 Tax=Pandoraea terrae TaxID=1537710 RepID=A0A5E4SFW8_9BURK|nr:GNAT family N-acetyltransferase [Pandoraea terrae]VVD73394.1 GCN5-related N-acetyltransferase [Pandoraea terrae]